MSDWLDYCENCGARLVQSANFCESCGKSVQKPHTTQPPQPLAQIEQVTNLPPPPSHVRPYEPQALPPKQKSTPWALIGIGGCLSFLCVAVVAAGIGIFARYQTGIQEITSLLPTQSEELTLPTEYPTLESPASPTDSPQELPALPTDSPEEAPTQAFTQPPEDDFAQEEEQEPIFPDDTGQVMGDTYFADDFSTNINEWAETHEQFHSFSLENGKYALYVGQEDYTIWAYLPIDFTPTTIGFDAAVVQGYEQGSYGVMCHFQDSDNFHFVTIDPLNTEYSIGYVLNNEYISLMRDSWMPSLFLNASPFSDNTILISCDQDLITLFINNELEAQVSTGPLTGGSVTISAETWDSISPNGFKVLFDNLFAFAPEQ